MTINRTAVLFLVIALCAAPPRPLRAAVENSPHDLIVQGYDVPKAGTSQERCSSCHLAMGASAPAAVVPEVPPSLRGRYGAASLICFSCHDGTTLVAPEVDASLTAFHPDSHGLDLTGYQTPHTLEIGLPYLTGDRMECVTCHDPHDNAHRPFLRSDLVELCLLCHSTFNEVTAADRINRTGNHPAGMDPDAVMRKDAPLQVSAAFKVPFPASYPLQKGKGSVGTHWDLGGHLTKGGSGEMSCITCHAVHGNEEVPPPPALLAVSPVNETANLFCEGCHRGQRGDGSVSTAAPNPGGTTTGRTYHPCDDDLANGTGRIVEIRTPTAWPFGAGEPPRLLCHTCHASHRAQVSTAILRPPVSATIFCGECHNELLLAYHHPLGEGKGKCAENIPATGVGENGGLTCGLCHRAHNAGLGAKNEKDYLPILKDSLLTDDLCNTCHLEGNPTCSTKAAGQASHFMGDPALTETYTDANPPIRKDPWPQSNLSSLFGGESGTGILCLSCHSFRSGAVTSGDLGKARFLLARSGNPVEWIDGEEAKYLCTGCHGVNPGTGNEPKGHTHPLMKADITKLKDREGLQVPILAPATNTPAGHVNCDSCHRPHEAVTKGGVYILEMVDGANTDPKAIQPIIDFTPTCHRCHPEK